MKRLSIGILVVFFLAAQVAVAFSESFTLEQLTGDDAPNTMIGWVEDIDLERGSILMGDTRFRFKKETLYLSVNNRPTDRNSFTEDMAVRFLAEERDILAIWHVDDPDGEYRPKDADTNEQQGPPQIEPVVADPSELDGVIRKQNGVWTN